MILKSPLTTFYQRCLINYNYGDRPSYLTAIKTSKQKNCFNPYISTECDVQIKLGGLIEEYFLANHLPYSVNAEMKIYDLPAKNQRADLSVHEVTPGSLYSEIDSHQKSLSCAFEIKFANAKHPNEEFKQNLILPDLNKLSSLPVNVEKFFVFLDEAEGLAPANADILIKECSERRIVLFSNNKYINYKLNYPFGSNQMFWLSKNKELKDLEYVFDTRNHFLQILKDCFQIISLDETTAEINFRGKKIIVIYAGEFDKHKYELEGHILIDTFGEFPCTKEEIKEIFGKIVRATSAYLFEVDGDTEKLVLE